MGSAFGWTVAIFAGFWLFLATRGVARDVRRGGSTKLLIGVMGSLFSLVLEDFSERPCLRWDCSASNLL